MAVDVIVTVESPLCREAAALVEELNRDLRDRYPPNNIHGVELEKLEGAQGFFVIARIDGLPVGCGAVRVLEPGVGEVKRMFLRPVARRCGVARAVLATLEIKAREMGIHLLVLKQAPAGRKQSRSTKNTDIAESPALANTSMTHLACVMRNP